MSSTSKVLLRKSPKAGAAENAGPLVGKMETMSISPVAEGAMVVSGIVKLGMGVYNAYQMNKIGRAARGAGTGIENLRNDMTRVRDTIHQIMDRQSCLAGLFAQGTSGITDRLDRLRKEMMGGFDKALGSIGNDDAKRPARELKMKLDVVAESYDAVIQGLMTLAENDGKWIPEFTKDDAKEAKRAATTLYVWAKAMVSDRLLNQNGDVPDENKRKAKLETMPYVMAMAYAVRVEMDACALVAETMEHERDRVAYLQRSQNKVDEFVGVVKSAVRALTAGTSLLEVAIEYHWHLAVYATLIKSFRAKKKMEAVSDAELSAMSTWDDGLGQLRKLFYQSADGGAQSRKIELTSMAEEFWWVQFTGADMKSTSSSQLLRSSIDVSDILYVLGEAQEQDALKFEMITDNKDALLQLPPALSLRHALFVKLANALGASQTLSSLDCLGADFARTRGMPEVHNMARPSTSATHLHRRLEHTFSGHLGAVYSVAVCGRGQRVVSGSHDSSVKVWSLSSGRLERTITGHTHWVLSVAVSSDGTRAVTGSADGSVRLWNLDTGLQEGRFIGHSGSVYAVAFARCGSGERIISGSDDYTVKVWQPNMSIQEDTLRGHTGSVRCVAVSPDGERVVSGGEDKTVRVWSMARRGQERVLQGHVYAVWSVAVSPDGQRAVSGSGDKSVRVWSLATGQLQFTLDGHTGTVWSLAFFPHGTALASSSLDKSIKIWDLDSQALKCTLDGHTDSVSSLAVSPDGQRLVSGSWDNTVKVWDGVTRWQF